MSDNRGVPDLLYSARWELLTGHFGSGFRLRSLLQSLWAEDSPESLVDLSTKVVQEIAAAYGPSETLLPAVEVLIAIAGELRPCSGPSVSVIVDISADLLEYSDGYSSAEATVRDLDSLTLRGFSAFVNVLDLTEDPADIDACIRLIGACAEMDPTFSEGARRAISPYVSSSLPRIRRLASNWLEIMNGQPGTA